MEFLSVLGHRIQSEHHFFHYFGLSKYKNTTEEKYFLKKLLAFLAIFICKFRAMIKFILRNPVELGKNR